ncbi:MAG: thiamine pyrophosphate-dependent enzyme [Chloroflexota bacterium]|nr:thiamine pyrophosphate-dependent enzyme [Dehalococcoidia bacterium]MDW8253464.1 thiamine pyrophosphate-dependent enzyme [Chloroflexota bacterium]
MGPALEAVRAIAAARTTQVVVTTMTAIFQWDDVVGDDPLHLPLIGCMGKASSLALGIALARPDIQVLCLDGDGSLLMNLGSLATIAQAQPANLVHFVFENRAYNITGGQPIPAAGRLDFALLAKAAGYPRAYTTESADQLRALLPEILAGAGPTFVCLRVAPAGPQPAIQHGRMKRQLAVVQKALAERQ